MADLLATFHVEGKLLLAQFVNFALVFVLIYFLVLKPLSKLMKSRTATIEKGLDDAKKAETTLMMADVEKERIVGVGHVEAKNIVLSAQSTGESIIETAKADALTEAQKVKEKALKELEALREREKSEVKEKSVDLVVAGVEAILREKIGAGEAEAMINKIAK